MTPGEEALAEAARLMSAEFYGRTCPETRSPRDIATPAIVEIHRSLRLVHSTDNTEEIA